MDNWRIGYAVEIGRTVYGMKKRRAIRVVRAMIRTGGRKGWLESENKYPEIKRTLYGRDHYEKRAAKPTGGQVAGRATYGYRWPGVHE